MRRVFATALAAALMAPAACLGAGPQPGSPEYFQRDNQNIQDGYRREFAPDGQVNNPAYTQAVLQDHGQTWLDQVAATLATLTRISISPVNFFPGWNVGNPFRRGWNGRRGQSTAIEYTNRYGALIRGHVYAPLPGAKDPYSGAELKPPFPGVVITTGSIQGSENMYTGLAADLAAP